MDIVMVLAMGNSNNHNNNCRRNVQAGGFEDAMLNIYTSRRTAMRCHGETAFFIKRCIFFVFAEVM